MKSKQFFERVVLQIISVYGRAEAESIAFLLLENQFQFTRNQFVINEKEFSESDFQKLNPFLKRLQNQEPIQYILNQAYFYEHDFYVNSDVLIPRPETEELVHLIINQNQKKSNLKILDIGTGSGCIPISLFHGLSTSEIHAVDISEKALSVAKKNAQNLNAQIHFHQLDILQNNLSLLPDFEIIVSNPPYVRELEKSQMQKNVLDFEPDLALFVSNENPLIFYHRIAKLASQKLKQGGKLYFEINENLGEEMISILKKYNFQQISLQKDMQNKNRMIFGEKL